MNALLINKFFKMQNAYLKDLVIKVKKQMGQAPTSEIVEKVLAQAKCESAIFYYEEDQLKDAITELVDNFCKP